MYLYIKDGDNLKKLLQAYPHLTVNVLIVGKKASKLAKENANKKEFRRVYEEGITKIYQDLDMYKNRVNIRSICDYDETAYLRGNLIMINNEIVFCSQIFWGFGMDRGIYNRAIITHSDNTLSRNFHYLFEKYFKESYPEHKVKDKFKYWAKRIGFPILFSTVISIGLTALLEPVFRLITEEYKELNYNFLSSFFAALIMFFSTKIIYGIKRKRYII